MNHSGCCPLIAAEFGSRTATTLHACASNDGDGCGWNRFWSTVPVLPIDVCDLDAWLSGVLSSERARLAWPSAGHR